MAPPILTRGRVAALLSLLAGVILFGYHARRVFVRKRRRAYKESGLASELSESPGVRSRAKPLGTSPRQQKHVRQRTGSSNGAQSPDNQQGHHESRATPSQGTFPETMGTDSEDSWILSSPSALSSLSSLTENTDTDTEIEEARPPKSTPKQKRRFFTKKSRLPTSKRKSEKGLAKTSESESDNFEPGSRSSSWRKAKGEDKRVKEKNVTAEGICQKVTSAALQTSPEESVTLSKEDELLEANWNTNEPTVPADPALQLLTRMQESKEDSDKTLTSDSDAGGDNVTQKPQDLTFGSTVSKTVCESANTAEIMDTVTFVVNDKDLNSSKKCAEIVNQCHSSSLRKGKEASGMGDKGLPICKESTSSLRVKEDRSTSDQTVNVPQMGEDLLQVNEECDVTVTIPIPSESIRDQVETRHDKVVVKDVAEGEGEKPQSKVKKPTRDKGSVFSRVAMFEHKQSDKSKDIVCADAAQKPDLKGDKKDKSEKGSKISEDTSSSITQVKSKLKLGSAQVDKGKDIEAASVPLNQDAKEKTEELVEKKSKAMDETVSSVARLKHKLMNQGNQQTEIESSKLPQKVKEEPGKKEENAGKEAVKAESHVKSELKKLANKQVGIFEEEEPGKKMEKEKEDEKETVQSESHVKSELTKLENKQSDFSKKEKPGKEEEKEKEAEGESVKSESHVKSELKKLANKQFGLSEEEEHGKKMEKEKEAEMEKSHVKSKLKKFGNKECSSIKKEESGKKIEIEKEKAVEKETVQSESHVKSELKKFEKKQSGLSKEEEHGKNMEKENEKEAEIETVKSESRVKSELKKLENKQSGPSKEEEPGKKVGTDKEAERETVNSESHVKSELKKLENKQAGLSKVQESGKKMEKETEEEAEKETVKSQSHVKSELKKLENKQFGLSKEEEPEKEVEAEKESLKSGSYVKSELKKLDNKHSDLAVCKTSDSAASPKKLCDDVDETKSLPILNKKQNRNDKGDNDTQSMENTEMKLPSAPKMRNTDGDKLAKFTTSEQGFAPSVAQSETKGRDVTGELEICDVSQNGRNECKAEVGNKDGEDELSSVTALKAKFKQIEARNQGDNSESNKRDESRISLEKGAPSPDIEEEKTCGAQGVRKVLQRVAMFEHKKPDLDSTDRFRRKSVASIYPVADSKEDVSLVKNKIRLLGGKPKPLKQTSLDDSSLPGSLKLGLGQTPELDGKPGNVFTKIKAFQEGMQGKESKEEQNSNMPPQKDESTKFQPEQNIEKYPIMEKDSSPALGAESGIGSAEEGDTDMGESGYYSPPTGTETASISPKQQGSLGKLFKVGEKANLPTKLGKDSQTRKSGLPMSHASQEGKENAKVVLPEYTGKKNQGTKDGGIAACQVEMGEEICKEISESESSSDILRTQQSQGQMTPNKCPGKDIVEQVHRRSSHGNLEKVDDLLQSPHHSASVNIHTGNTDAGHAGNQTLELDGVTIVSSGEEILEKSVLPETLTAVDCSVEACLSLCEVADDVIENQVLQQTNTAEVEVNRQEEINNVTDTSLQDQQSSKKLSDEKQVSDDNGALPSETGALVPDMTPGDIPVDDNDFVDTTVTLCLPSGGPAAIPELDKDLLSPHDLEDQESSHSGRSSITVLSQTEQENGGADDVEIVTSVSANFHFLPPKDMGGEESDTTSNVLTADTELKIRKQVVQHDNKHKEDISLLKALSTSHSKAELTDVAKSASVKRDLHHTQDTDSEEETQLSGLAMKVTLCESKRELELKKSKTSQDKEMDKPASTSKIPGLKSLQRQKSPEIVMSRSIGEAEMKRALSKESSIPRVEDSDATMRLAYGLSKSMGDLEVKSKKSSLPTCTSKIPMPGVKTPPRKMSASTEDRSSARKSQIPGISGIRLNRSKSEGRLDPSKTKASEDRLSKSFGDSELDKELQEPQSRLPKFKALSSEKKDIEKSKIVKPKEKKVTSDARASKLPNIQRNSSAMEKKSDNLQDLDNCKNSDVKSQDIKSEQLQGIKMPKRATILPNDQSKPKKATKVDIGSVNLMHTMEDSWSAGTLEEFLDADNDAGYIPPKEILARQLFNDSGNLSQVSSVPENPGVESFTREIEPEDREGTPVQSGVWERASHSSSESGDEVTTLDGQDSQLDQQERKSQGSLYETDSLDGASLGHSAKSEDNSEEDDEYDDDINNRFDFGPDGILYEHPQDRSREGGVIYEGYEYEEDETSFIDNTIKEEDQFGEEHDLIDWGEDVPIRERLDKFSSSPGSGECETDSLEDDCKGRDSPNDDNPNMPDLLGPVLDEVDDEFVHSGSGEAMSEDEEVTGEFSLKLESSPNARQVEAPEEQCGPEEQTQSDCSHGNWYQPKARVSGPSQQEDWMSSDGMRSPWAPQAGLAISIPGDQGQLGLSQSDAGGIIEDNRVLFTRDDEVWGQNTSQDQTPCLLPPPGAGKGRRVRPRAVQPDSPRSLAKNDQPSQVQSPEPKFQKRNEKKNVPESVLERVPLLYESCSSMTESSDSAILDSGGNGATSSGNTSRVTDSLPTSVSDPEDNDVFADEPPQEQPEDIIFQYGLQGDASLDQNLEYRKELRDMFRTLDRGMYRMTGRHAEILVRHLATPDFDFLCKILVTISNTAAFTRNQDLLREAGCLERLGRLLRGHSMALHVGQSLHYPAVVSSVATTISNLAVNEENQTKLQECIPALIDFAVSEQTPESVQLSSLQALTNLSVTPGFHAPYTKLVQTLYELVDSHDEPRQMQALKVLVNLSANPDMVPHLLAAKTPTRLLELLSPGTDEGVTLRWINILANVIWTAHDRGITYAALPTEYKAPSPETLYTALYGHSNSVQLRTKAFLLSKSKNQDIRYHAARIYSCLV